MNDVQFQDQHTYTAPKKKGLSQMVIKMGLAKDEKGAQMVLLIIAGVALAAALFFIFSSGGGEPAVSPEDLITS